MRRSKEFPTAFVICARVIAGAEPMTRVAVTMKTGSSAMLCVLMVYTASSGTRTARTLVSYCIDIICMLRLTQRRDDHPAHYAHEHSPVLTRFRLDHLLFIVIRFLEELSESLAQTRCSGCVLFQC